MKSFIITLSVLILSMIGTPTVGAQEKSIVSDTKEKTKELFKDGKKGVTNLFNKAKEKVVGLNNVTDTVVTEKAKNDKPAKKPYTFKKQKVKEYFSSRTERTFNTKYQTYKGSNGVSQNLEFDAFVWYDQAKNTIYHRYFIYRVVPAKGKQSTLPKGNEILIRTANQVVSKAVTLMEFTNEQESHTLHNSNTGYSYGTHLEWGNIDAYYYLTDETVNDIIEYGIIKLRTDTYDLVLEGKEFEKAHQLMANYLLSLKEEVDRVVRIWKANPPRTQQRSEF